MMLGELTIGTYYYLKDLLVETCVFLILKMTIQKKTKCWSFMLNQAKPFEIPSVELVSSLNVLKDMSC